MSVRKMITFQARGIELLAEATGGAKERAAGEYLTAVLAQRRRAWSRALDTLLAAGYPRAEIHELVGAFSRRGATIPEIGKVLTRRELAADFHALVLEFEAGNRALVGALEGESV